MYTSGETGPLLVFLHGGGFSALSWAILCVSYSILKVDTLLVLQFYSLVCYFGVLVSQNQAKCLKVGIVCKFI